MTPFFSSIAASLFLLSSPEIQLGDPFAMFPPVAASGERHREELYAARGESESIAVWVRNDEAMRQLDACRARWMDGAEIPLQAYVVAPVPGGASSAALEPLTGIPLAPDALLHLFLRIQVPVEAPPGRHEIQIALEFDGGEVQAVPLALEVFDFTIPALPSLTVVMGIDRPAIKQACGLGESLAEWQPSYDLLAGARTGFQVWPESTAARGVFYDYSAIDQVKEHLGYVARMPGLPALGIGGQAGKLLKNWPAPALDSPQDPLQLLLFSVMGHLEGHGWSRPAVLIPETLPDRTSWQHIRETYARVARSDKRVARLLAAPAHPYFERYTDIWALPPETPPDVMAALRAGESLVRYPTTPITAHTSSETALDTTGSYQTHAADAFDGSDATVWRASPSKDNRGKPWLEATLPALDLLETITVIWSVIDPGLPPVLETAFHPDSFSNATVNWETIYHATEGGLAASVGVIKYPRECGAIRLRFEAPSGKGVVAVAEVLLNQDVRRTVTQEIAPVLPWLDLRRANAALAMPETAAIAARTFPWFCWEQGFVGILGPVLGASMDEAGAFVTCGPGGLMPTSALFHLSDGLEDYEYLKEYEEAVRRGKLDPPADFRPGFLLPPAAVGLDDHASRALELVREQRKRMGRLLSGQRTVTRNFGPRS